MDCTVENRKTIPLTRVMSAALVDTYEDAGRYEQRASHWAARGLRKLYTESLPSIKHKAWLPVNPNFHTATLPPDFDREVYVGFVDSNWNKIPMKISQDLVDIKNIVDTPCEDLCPKCNQDTNICNDLVVTEEKEQVIVNSLPYEKTTTKKLYPNGDYWLEVSTPVYSIVSGTVAYNLTREFIVNFSLKPCGCLDTTAANTANLQTFCPDVYCNYYAPCQTACNTSYGSYTIFPESNIIQLDKNYPFEKVYVEYYGFIQKIRGEYMVPMVSFETLVEWTKYKMLANKRNVPRWERKDQEDAYVKERRNMEKILGRFSLSSIMQAVIKVPKFDRDYGGNWYSSFQCPAGVTLPPITVSTDSGCIGVGSSGSGSGSGNTNIYNNSFTIINQTGGFVLAVKVDGTTGAPVAGETTYQNNLLIGATDVNYIMVAHATETILDGDFTFDNVTGTIDRAPNQWQTGDSLIINYNKAA